MSEFVNMDLEHVTGSNGVAILEQDLGVIDAHAHTGNGDGVKLSQRSLTFDGETSFNNQRIYLLTETGFVTVTTQPTTSLSVYVYSTDGGLTGGLFFNNFSGLPIQITSGIGLNTGSSGVDPTTALKAATNTWTGAQNTFNNRFEIGGSLGVQGSLVAAGLMFVSGSLTAAGTLTVPTVTSAGTDTVFSKGVTVSGRLEVTGTLKSNSRTILSGTTILSGSDQFVPNVQITGSLDVQNGLLVGTTVLVGSPATPPGNHSIGSAGTLFTDKRFLSAGGGTAALGTDVRSNESLISGSLTVTNTLTVNNDGASGGTITSAQDRVRIAKSLSVEAGNMEVTGSARASKTIRVFAGGTPRESALGSLDSVISGTLYMTAAPVNPNFSTIAFGSNETKNDVQLDPLITTYFFNPSSTDGCVVTGLSSQGMPYGWACKIIVSGLGTINFKNNNVGSTSGNRIKCPRDADTKLGHMHCIEFMLLQNGDGGTNGASTAQPWMCVGFSSSSI